mmetsp:Transcript_30678/g.76618  ORF Transcript_30678/g.76618 Transcript_30678/m.76618 type:complete len:104 (-) Transcript_30678:1440-1751(-)
MRTLLASINAPEQPLLRLHASAVRVRASRISQHELGVRVSQLVDARLKPPVLTPLGMVDSKGAGIGGGAGNGGGLGGLFVPTVSQSVRFGLVSGGGMYVSGFL